MREILEKCLGARLYFSPNLANLQPVTALISTAGNHKPPFNLYGEFKGFVDVTLYTMNKWGCILGWISLDEVPYLVR